MATVHFTTALERFVPNLESIEVSGDTASEVVAEIEKHFPGVKGYIDREDQDATLKSLGLRLRRSRPHLYRHRAGRPLL